MGRRGHAGAMAKFLTAACAALALLLPAAAQARQAPAAAPCSGPEWRALDFWVGDWVAEWDGPDGQVLTGSNRITRDEFGRCVIVERFKDPNTGLDGFSVSTWHAAEKAWRQTWVDNTGGFFDLTGGPVAGEDHVFELVNRRPEGAGFDLRMIWQDVTPEAFVWRWQARPVDGGEWTDRWVIRYRRAD